MPRRDDRFVWNDGDIVIIEPGQDDDASATPSEPPPTPPADPNATKFWEESDHPRGDDGRFIESGDIAAAASNPRIRQSLEDRVTKPAEQIKLRNAIDRAGAIQSDKPKGYEFFSPNTEENLTFKQAFRNLDSNNQSRMRFIAEDIAKQATKATVVSHNAIGDWSDGAENSIVQEIRGNVSLDQLKYAAAQIGSVANQKATLAFVAEKDGPDAVWSMELKGKTLEDARSSLQSHGIEFRTLEPIGDGVKVYVFDQGRKLASKLEDFANEQDIEVSGQTGRGEFIGAESRAAAKSVYKQIIDGYESDSTKPRYRPDAGRNDNRRGTASEVKHPPVFDDKGREISDVFIWAAQGDKGKERLLRELVTDPAEVKKLEAILAGPPVIKTDLEFGYRGKGVGYGGHGETNSDKPSGRWHEREHPGKGYTRAARVVDGKVVTSNVHDAARALYEGKKVELKQPREAATLIKHLAKVAQRMEKMGGKVPNFNLCSISVQGTNLFCAKSLGIPRVQMPQLDDEQTKAFVKSLEGEGFKAVKSSEKSAFLRATQNELNGEKVAGIMAHLRKVGEGDKRLIVSSDNYILDGHHHWAAQVGIDATDNHLGDTRTKIIRINASITTLLEKAEKFTGGKGHKAASERTTK